MNEYEVTIYYVNGAFRKGTIWASDAYNAKVIADSMLTDSEKELVTRFDIVYVYVIRTPVYV